MTYVYSGGAVSGGGVSTSPYASAADLQALKTDGGQGGSILITATGATTARTAAQWAADAVTAVSSAATAQSSAAAAQTAAETAQTAAETARDAALSGAQLYADTTAGLAATTNGQFFSVPSAVSAESLLLYKNNSGSELLVKTYPAASAVTTVALAAGSATGSALTTTSSQTKGQTAATGTAVWVGLTWFQLQPAARRGYLSQLRFWAMTTGLIKVKVLGPLSTSSAVDVLQVVTVSISATGATTLNAGIDLPYMEVPEGGFIALYADTGQCQFAYTAGPETPAYYINGDIAGAGNAIGSRVVGVRLNWGYDIATQDVAQAKLEPALRRAITPAFAALAQQAVGYAAANGGSTIGAAYTLWHATPAQRRGVVSSLSLYVTATGLLRLKVLSAMSPAGTVDVLSTALVSLNSIGAVTLSASVDLPYLEIPEGGYLAIYGGSGAAAIAFTSGTVGTPFYIVSGELNGAGNQIPAATSTSRLDWSYTIDSYPVRASQLDPADRRKVDGAGTISGPLEVVSSFSVLPAQWANGAGSWTFAGGKASSGATGNTLGSTRSFAISKRRMRWEFQITNATTDLRFLTTPTESIYSFGSMVRLATANNEIEIQGAYTGSNSPTTLQATSLGFSLVTGRRYVMEWEIDSHLFTVRVWDKAGSGYAAATRTATLDPTGGATPWGDHGEAAGSPGVKVIAGSADIYSFSHNALAATSPTVYVVGDSITAGFPNADADKYGSLLAAKLGSTRVAMSGISGATMTGAMDRMRAELLSLRPTYVLVFLGTNADATYSTALTAVVALIESLGATPIVCTVPTDATKTAAVNALGADVIKVALDLALTTSGAGSGLIGGLYADGLHPNAAGHAAIYARILLDAPEVVR